LLLWRSGYGSMRRNAKMDEFMLQLSYEHEPVPLQVNVPVNPLNVAVNPVKVSVKTQEHIYGYCMKCRSKAEIKNPHHVTMKNRRHAVQVFVPGAVLKCSGSDAVRE